MLGIILYTSERNPKNEHNLVSFGGFHNLVSGEDTCIHKSLQHHEIIGIIEMHAPTPVFLPGESQGWGSLVCCCLWGCTELDTTEAI